MNDLMGLSCKPLCDNHCTASKNLLTISQMMQSYGRVQSFEKGDVLVRFQEKPISFWRIETGWVRLLRLTPDGTETTTGLLTIGDTFGEGAFFEEALSTYTAEVISQTATLTAVFRPHIGGAWVLPPVLLHELSSLFYSKMNRLQLRSEQFLAMSASQRLGCFVLSLFKQARNRESSVRQLELPFEKHILANYLGMKPETFSRCMKQLADFGVHVQGHFIIADNMKALTQFVCDSCSDSGVCETEKALSD